MNKHNFALLAVAAAFTACVTVPATRPAPVPPAPPPSQTKVYFYPTQGQSDAQQDRDRYECHNWSVRQTGFDPSLRVAAREERATVVPARSAGQTIGAAAAVGAVIGAVAAGPGDVGKGAVVGAMAGTVLGSAAASADQVQSQQVRRVRNTRDSGRYARQAGEFRRAMSACLEGRGYSVK